MARLFSPFPAPAFSAGHRARPRRPRRENVSFLRSRNRRRKGRLSRLPALPAQGRRRQSAVRAGARHLPLHRAALSISSRTASRSACWPAQFRRSPFHLQRTFKAALGVSPKAYIDACRLRQRQAESASRTRRDHRALCGRIRLQQPPLRAHLLATRHDARKISPRRDGCRRSLHHRAVRRSDAC